MNDSKINIDIKDIVIIGAGGHAKVVIDVIERQARYNIIGLIDKSHAKGENVLGYEILGDEDVLHDMIQEYPSLGGIIAIGDNFVRYKIYKQISLSLPEFVFISAVHPEASIGKDVFIGDGTVIMAGAIVNTCCCIGRFCIINTNSSIDHDSIMEDFSSLAPNAATGGNVKIGEFSAVGIGAVLAHNINIGRHSVIGTGAAVVKDIADYSVAYGVPAEVIRKRKEGERYL